ncbi:hypothetical protein WR25_09334 isoform B [Diploscapter pachys]|uniref:Uncharacterized protein n=1 Tax=Diploscapter pachys TaxID=2018661 RepID=A0A2A2L588_9BILA|nr:hypothetical protein WR25_09334 isoform B [Diploscapter pachys]
MADKQRQGVNKKMQVEEMKHRLKEGVKSLNENFLGIFRAAKIDSGNPQQQGGNHAMGQAGPRAATKEEMAARAALMISRISQSFDLSGVNFPENLDNFLFFNYFKMIFHPNIPDILSEKIFKKIKNQKKKLFLKQFLKGLAGLRKEQNTAFSEGLTRSHLQVKACDDLKTLTNEMREFFIVNDFAVVDSALRK